ncbi:Gfo/Idh/MocA family protein [Paenibacillus piri]|nr:Gfo/Idh/MocA family oxidoreductase [Paenibacillus piri]
MMKIAVIGAGETGKRYVQHLLNAGQTEIAGVYDTQLEAASALAQRCGCPAFPSMEALDAALPRDTVYNCLGLPEDSQMPYLFRALAGGRQVIARMPAADSVEDVQALLEAAEAHGGRLLFSHPERFYYHNIDLKHRIEAGSIGRIGTINVKRYLPLRPTAFRQDESGASGVHWMGGNYSCAGEPKDGALFGLALHDIDLLRWTLGEVANVYAMHTASGESDYVLVTLKFRQGSIANIEAYRGYPGGYTAAVEYAGSKGVIRYDNRKTNALQIHKTENSASWPHNTQFSPSFRHPELDELVHLLSCLRNGSQPMMTVEDVRETLKVVHAAQQSIRTGQPVQLGVDRVNGIPGFHGEANGGGEHA